MTLWASKDGQAVTIHGNIGLDVKVQNGRVTEFAVTETTDHIRHFWGQLGDLLAPADTAEEAAVDA